MNQRSNQLAKAVRANADWIIQHRFSYRNAPPMVEALIQRNAIRSVELAREIISTDKRYSQS